jgi:DNA-binding transcriptional regulator YhcF (GntR family)
MKGWIKLHRKVLDNKIYRHDLVAWHIFETLLITADKESGKWSGGMFQLADLCGVNRNTLYKAILRLEKEKMITRSVNTQYTVYYICRWDDYQSSSETLGKHKVNAKQTQSNTLTRIKNKELRNNTIVETQSVYDLYIKSFQKNTNTYKLTSKRKIKIQARLKDNGKEMLEKAILNTSNSSFHRGDNDRGWQADLDFIIKSYEQVEKLASFSPQSNNQNIDINTSQEKWIPV